MTTSRTSAATPEKTRVKLDRDPGQLLAAIPHILGFHPIESVVLIGHRPSEPSVLGWVLRGDLPPTEFEAEQAAEMAARLGMSDAFGATVMVVGGTVGEGPAPDADPPHSTLVTALTDACADAGLRLLHALWVPTIRAGAGWLCYMDRGCSGTVPDPASTPVAATVASTGKVTFDSREEMAELLTADDSAALLRRSAALDESMRAMEPCGCAGEGEQDPFDDRCAVVGAALRQARAARLHLTDEQVVNLAMAISDVRVRDACLATALPPGGELAMAAETLWTALVRAMPGPERAEVAALLGYSAYLRGDGALAGMALHTALESTPDHVLASLLDRALQHGITPERLEGIGRIDGVADLWRAGAEE